MADKSFSLFLHIFAFAFATVAAMNDENYKRLFAFPRTVGDLLRAVGEPGWTRDVEFGTLQKLSAEHIGERGQKRLGDSVWRVRFRDVHLYLLVLLEFQSTKDSFMALRNLEYTALLYRELKRAGQLGAPGNLPPVLPLVLYNGDTPWTDMLEMRELIAPVPPFLGPFQPSQRSLVLDERHMALDDLPADNLMRAVVGLEQSRTPADMARVTMGLRDLLREPADRDLGRAFVLWIQDMATRADRSVALDLGETLEEASMSLADRVAQWPEQYRQEGRREGVAEGRREGVVEGRREGIFEGLRRERALLRRLANLRFGASVADRVEATLADIDDWEQLAEAGEIIVRAETSRDLTRRMAKEMAASD